MTNEKTFTKKEIIALHEMSIICKLPLSILIDKYDELKKIDKTKSNLKEAVIRCVTGGPIDANK